MAANQIDVFVYRVISASPPSTTGAMTFDKVFHAGLPVAGAHFYEINSIFGTDLPGMPQIYGKIVYNDGLGAGANLREAYVMNTVAQLITKANA